MGRLLSLSIIAPNRLLGDPFTQVHWDSGIQGLSSILYLTVGINGGNHYCDYTRAVFKVCLRVDSVTAFGPVYIQGLSRRHLRDVTHFRVEEKETKGYSKMAAGPTNQNCSFDCKRQPLYGGCHFEEPFQPIRVLLLNANGSFLWRLPFPRQNCVQSKEATHISP